MKSLKPCSPEPNPNRKSSLLGTTAVPLSGQCTPHKETGTWFSHTAGGKCADGARPARGVCSWRVVERVKTISLHCLAAAMTDACRADIAAAGGSTLPAPGKFIYNTSLPIFLNALASDDIATGGCPPI